MVQRYTARTKAILLKHLGNNYIAGIKHLTGRSPLYRDSIAFQEDNKLYNYYTVLHTRSHDQQTAFILVADHVFNSLVMSF